MQSDSRVRHWISNENDNIQVWKHIGFYMRKEEVNGALNTHQFSTTAKQGKADLRWKAK